MKDKGFTIVEVLVVTLIAVSLMGIIFGTLLVGRNTWVKNAAYIDLQQKARYAIDKMAKELSQSTSDIDKEKFDTGHCADGGPAGYSCIGDWILFQVPVADENNSIYDSEGNVKWGAANHPGWSILYLVSSEPPNENRLMSIILADPTGACCEESHCYVKTQINCQNAGGNWKGAGSTCPAACPACFLAGTAITMADGSIKDIEKIKVGDKIFAFDEKSKKVVEDKVIDFFEHDADEYLIVNGYLKLTANHPVYSDGKWKEIGKLKIGDNLLNAEGRPIEITSIKAVKEPVKVYNLEVNPYHTYIAGGIVVHNKVVVIPEPDPPPFPCGGEEECPYSKKDSFYDLLRKIIAGPLAFADELAILASNIQTMTIVNPEDNPKIVQITITAQETTMLGEPITVTLYSTIYLRNQTKE